VLLASCSGTDSASPNKTAENTVRAADIAVKDTMILRSEGRGFVASPSGESMALVDDRRICITSIDGTGSEKCTTETLPADVLSMRWSPDSKRLVFTETYFDIGQDRAAFVVDAASGKLATLTDDNPSGVDSTSSDVIVDLFPSFTPDSSTIVFWRFDLAADTATVMTVPATGGAPSQLATDVSIPGRAVTGRVTVVEQSMFFSRKSATDTDVADVGIYRANRDGTDLKLFARPTEGQGRLELRSVSAALNTAIVADVDQLNGARPLTEPFSTLDLASGVLTPISSKAGVVLGATFSRNGQQVLVVAAGTPGPDTNTNGLSFAVRDGIGGADATLAGVGDFVALNDAGGHSVQWLEGNRVLITNTFTSAIAYQLG
jgi:dipeptidyl aminopeptidase/acylaminoacyl peptidase